MKVQTVALTEAARVYVRGDNKVMLYRLTKTGTLFLSWICLGLFNEVVGPTLSELKTRVNSNYEEISRVLSARSAGLFIGSLLGGVLYDRFTRRRDIILAASLLLSGSMIGAVPWCRDLWLLAVLFHLMGHGHALLTTGGNPSITLLWADQAAGPYNFLHTGFGVGAGLGPLICRPFLAPDANSSGSNYRDRDDVTANGTRAGWAPSSRIEYPYLFVGGLCLLVAVPFVAFYAARSRSPAVFDPDEERQASRIFSPARCAGGDGALGCQILALVFVYYVFVVGGERTYGKFLFSFAVDGPLRFSDQRATWLNTVYWLSYTIARLLASLAARRLTIQTLIFVEVFGALAAAVGLNVCRDRAEVFWIFTSALGLFTSPLFPSGLGWANRYVEVTSMTIMCVNIGSSIGGMTMQWLTGYLFQYYGPTSFVHVIVANTALVCSTFTVMHLVARRHGERYLATGAARPVGDNAISTVELSKFDRRNTALTS